MFNFWDYTRQSLSEINCFRISKWSIWFQYLSFYRMFINFKGVEVTCSKPKSNSQLTLLLYMDETPYYEYLHCTTWNIYLHLKQVRMNYIVNSDKLNIHTSRDLVCSKLIKGDIPVIQCIIILVTSQIQTV